MNNDLYYVGILPEFNFKFLITDCSKTISEAISRNHLMHSSATLVAKSMISCFFIAGMVKEEVVISIQLEGNGEIERVITYSSRDGKMRGLAKNLEIIANPEDPTNGIGTGVFRVTRWGGIQKLHQSLTKLENTFFENNLLNYINDSDQLISFAAIHVDQNFSYWNGYGIFFQALPNTSQEQIDNLLNKIHDSHFNLFQLFSKGLEKTHKDLETILNTQLKILETGSPQFFCGCSMDKIKNMLVSLGKEEIERMLEDEEDGEIEITCEFCQQKYTLDAEESLALF